MSEGVMIPTTSPFRNTRHRPEPPEVKAPGSRAHRRPSCRGGGGECQGRPPPQPWILSPTEFLDDLAAASTKEALHEVIPLLGAVGRAQVLRNLFNYLGANAEYDDVALHRVAA